MKYLITTLAMLALLQSCAAQPNFRDYVRTTGLSSSWFQDNYNDLDNLTLLDDLRWNVRFVRVKGKRAMTQSSGYLDLTNPDSSVFRLNEDYFVGSFVSVDDGSGFKDIYRIVLKSSGQIEYGEEFVQFQIRKVTASHLVLDFFQLKRKRLEYSLRVILDNGTISSTSN